VTRTLAGEEMATMRDRAWRRMTRKWNFEFEFDCIEGWIRVKRLLMIQLVYTDVMSGERDELTSAGEEKRLRFCVSYSPRLLSAISIGVLTIVLYTTQIRKRRKEVPNERGTKRVKR
jgi:hypothetical protein